MEPNIPNNISESEIHLAQTPSLKKSIYSKIVRLFSLTTLLVVLIGGGFLINWLDTIGVFNLEKSNLDQIANYTYQDNSIVYDNKGDKIGEFFEKFHIFVPISSLPRHFSNALIAIEDRNFYTHHGVDFKGMTRAAVQAIKKRKTTQGASTLTQQLVRNTILTSERTLQRKALEIAWALEVERNISKEKILEIYTNKMFLGHGSYGVGAAARRYFGKSVEELTPAESALIAGLYQSPSRYNPAKYPKRAKARQLQVISAMLSNKMITKEEAASMRKEPLNYQEYKYINNQRASWFVDYIQEQISKIPEIKSKINRGNGLRIYTTLDPQAQSLAEKSIELYSKKLSELEARTGKVLDSQTATYKNASIEAAMLVTDPKSGEILAMVGGRDYKKSQFNRAANAMRSPGSAFKPIVYTEALIRGYKWSDIIFVSPINIENYKPKNIEEDYLTETTLMRAFYRSMNAPAMELASKIGLHALISRAKKFGIQSPIKDEFGSALGSSDVSMLDMARMYGTFANTGITSDLSSITKITSANGDLIWERKPLAQRQKRTLNEQISYLMTQGMRSVLSSGTGANSRDLATIAAGKTGTSNENSDNWFCGYTSNLVSIVWVGTDEHAPILANVSGGSIALPIWDQFIRTSASIRPQQPFYRPNGIVEANIHPQFGHKVSSGANMYFLESNQPDDSDSPLEALDNTISSGGYRNVFRH